MSSKIAKTAADANRSGVTFLSAKPMAANTILKNGRSPKSQTSKISALIILVAGIFITFNTCKKDNDENVPQNVIELVNQVEGFTEKPVWAEKEEIVQGSDSSWYEQTNDDPRVRSSSRLTSSSKLDCYAFNVKWNCVTKRYSASQNPDDFVMFNPLASVLWPGNLVQGASLETGVPTSVPVTKRQSGNISLAIVTSGSAGAAMYRTVDKMQFSHVNQAMNDILSGFSGQGYAQYNFEMNIIKSSAHLEFLLNASFAGWGASVRAGLSTSSSEELTRILVKLHQSYFTMVYDDPAGLDGVFTPDITVNDLRNYTGDGNPICYISSVTYGRMYYILFESSTKEDELTAALNASYKGWGVTAGFEMDVKTKETFSKTTARVFQMGGGGEGGITAGMAVDLEAIRNFMEKGINFNAQNTGAPISYTVKYLKDAKIVKLNNAMEYEVPDCEPEVTGIACPNPPELTTNDATNITATSAILGGNIIFAGEPPYAERGVIYGISPNRDNANNKVEPISGTGTTGNFSEIITGLTPGTTYYVWAYANNEDGTGYGEQVSFTTSDALPPVLSTNNVTTYTATTATLGGNITFAGEPPYFERGVVYATTENPTTADEKSVDTGTGLGNFSVSVSNLTPNTTYYVRAYAINTEGYPTYGGQRTFKTPVVLPVVSTNNPTNLTSNSATLGGAITNAGTPPYTERGIVYATTENPTTDNFKKVIPGTGTGNFSDMVTGLTVNTTYYVRVYAINSDETTYGQQVIFKLGTVLSLTTNEPENVTANSAALGGTITNVGTPPYTERGVVYSTNQNPTINDFKKTIPGTGMGSFSVEVTGLTVNTKYYVRAYAINSEEPEYGQEASFTTFFEPPRLTTNDATNITVNSATLGGKITNVGSPPYYQRGVCFSTNPNPTIDDVTKIISGTGTGDFDANVTGLTANTRYYAKAYAINAAGTEYGNEVSFVTGEHEMVYVQGGTFTMGEDGENGQVTLSSFNIGKYEVTQAQWVAVMGSNPSCFKGDNLPVEQVSWNDIVGTSGASIVINGIIYYENGFIYRLNQLTGKRYRLPTEAEWEYAARGGNKSKGYIYSGSNNIDDVAWYNDNSGGITKPVGTKAPNELGIFDMSGNVLEWCSDWAGEYTTTAKTNPLGPNTGSSRVHRGGDFQHSTERSTVYGWVHDANPPDWRCGDLGFRLVLP